MKFKKLISAFFSFLLIGTAFATIGGTGGGSGGTIGTTGIFWVNDSNEIQFKNSSWTLGGASNRIPNTAYFNDIDSTTATVGGFTGSIYAADGSVSAPSISFSNDTNTGFYSANSNAELGVTVNGVDVLRGITATTGVNYFTMTPSATGADISLGSAGADADVDIKIAPKGSGNLFINSSVGIKTAIPTAELDVTGSGVFSGSVLGGNTRIDDDGIDFRLASLDDMIIQNYALDKGIIFKHNLGVGQEIMLDMDSATETHDFQDWDITTTGIVGIGKAPVVGSRLNLPLENDAVTPTLSFGDGDSGFYESADDTLSIATAGVVRALITDAYIESSASNPNWRLQRETASATNPVYAFGADDDTGIGSAAADQLSLIAGGVEQMRLTQNDATDDVVSITGNVGIGTTAPDGRLHVMTASAGTVTADSSADDFVIENSTHGGLTILTTNTTTGGIYFGDPDDNNAGRINYGHSADQMEFLVNSVVNGGATALTIQPDMDVIINSGNVGIGTTAPAFKLDVVGNIGIDRSPDTDDTGSGITAIATVDTNAFGVGACLVMAADGNYDTADADASTTAPCEAMALETGTGTKKVMLQGYVRNDGWNWTMSTGISNLLYLSTTTGEITQTAPSGAGDQVQIIGRAISADVIYFDPSFVIVEISA